MATNAHVDFRQARPGPVSGAGRGFHPRARALNVPLRRFASVKVAAPQPGRSAGASAARALRGRPEAPPPHGADPDAPQDHGWAQLIALGIAGAALAAAPLARPRAAGAEPLPPAAAVAPERSGGLLRAVWGAAKQPARALDAALFPDLPVIGHHDGKNAEPTRADAKAEAAAAPQKQRRGKGVDATPPAATATTAAVAAAAAAAAAESTPAAPAAAAVDAATSAGPFDAAAVSLQELRAAAAARAALLWAALSSARAPDIAGWLQTASANSVAMEASGAPTSSAADAASTAPAVAGATLAAAAAAAAVLALGAAAVRAAAVARGGSFAFPRPVLSGPLPIPCFSPWPDAFAAMPADIAPRYYDWIKKKALRRRAPAAAAAAASAHPIASHPITLGDAFDATAPGRLAAARDALAAASLALAAAASAPLPAGAAAPKAGAVALLPSDAARGLGEAVGAVAAITAAAGSTAGHLQSAWVAAIRDLGAARAARELPAALSTALDAAGPTNAPARRLVLLSLTDAVGVVSDGAVPGAALSVMDAASLLAGVGPCFGSLLPLALASAFAGRLRAGGWPAGTNPRPSSSDGAEAAATARAAVTRAVHAPKAAPPAPAAAALGPAVAEALMLINANASAPDAHALMRESGAALAACGPAALAAALAALPAAAAGRPRPRGWATWGPMLAAICGGGCGPSTGVNGASLLEAMTAAVEGTLAPDGASLPAGPRDASAADRVAAARRARSAALAAAALLSWMQETDDGACAPRRGAPAAYAPRAGAGGPLAMLSTRRALAEAAAAAAAAAAAPASVVGALGAQWQLGLVGAISRGATAGGRHLAELDHAAFLDPDVIAGSLQLPPSGPADTHSPPPAAAAPAFQGFAPAAAPKPMVPLTQARPKQRPAAAAHPAMKAAASSAPRTAPPPSPFAAFARKAATAAEVDAAEAAEAAAEAALDDLLGEVLDTADRLCRRLTLDAALLGRWPAAAAAADGPGAWSRHPANVSARSSPGGVTTAGRCRTGPFSDASELALHLKALARTAPSRSAARARLLPLRNGLLHLERLAARLPCPEAGWFGGAGNGPSSGPMIWTLHEALWGPADASAAGAACAAPPPPSRLLALALGLLPTEAAASASAQARAAGAAERSGLAAAVEAGEAEAFPSELLVGPLRRSASG